jgi:RNA polymerase sigma-70 factor, ECF subfamily
MTRNGSSFAGDAHCADAMNAIATAPSDEELVGLYQQSQDAQVFEELVRRRLDRIRSLIYQMVLDDAAADDLCQEVFLRAYRGLPGFHGKARFSTWLFRIAMNSTHDYLRQRKSSPVEFRAQLPEGGAPLGSPPDEAALRSELEAKIESALGSLSPKLRAAIVLTSLHEKSPQEAATIEGCSTATMYWRIHKARKLLKEKLQDYLA